MFIAGVGESLWLPVILAVFCVAGIFAGIMLRVQAFLFLGVGFLLLDLFAMIWHAAVDRSQTWVWYVSGIMLGAAILACSPSSRSDAMTCSAWSIGFGTGIEIAALVARVVPPHRLTSGSYAHLDCCDGTGWTEVGDTWGCNLRRAS